MSSKTYQLTMPKKIKFGVGALETLADELSNWGTSTALVITDAGVNKAGLIEPIKEQLAKAEVATSIFTGSEPEPTLSKLDAIADEYRKKRFDILLAVGGGSSIDTAKGISVLMTHGGKGIDYLGIDLVPGPCIPVVAVPTTAGTGSEATNIAIFGDTERQLKLAIVIPNVLPRL